MTEELLFLEQVTRMGQTKDAESIVRQYMDLYPGTPKEEAQAAARYILGQE